MRDMARWAAREGLRTPGGKPLDRVNVQKALSNVTYAGYVAYKRRQNREAELVKGQHPPIVSLELFQRAQEVRQARRRNPLCRRGKGEPYPLSGLARCLGCQERLIGTVNIQGERRTRYMRCRSTALLGRSACRQRMVPAELLEGQLAAYVDGLRLPRDYVQRVLVAYADRCRDKDGEAARRRRLEAEMERWRRLYVLGDIEEARYLAEVRPLKLQLAALAVPRVAADLERAATYLTNVGALFAQASLELQRRFVEEVLDEVGVEGPWVRHIKPKPQYAPLFALDRAERFGGDRCYWLPGQDSKKQVSTPGRG